MNKRKAEDYIYSIVVGSLYMYALNLAIITSTVIEVSAPRLFMTGLIGLLLCMLLLLNRVTMVVSGVVLAIAAFFTWLWLAGENMDKTLAFINELLLLARGLVPYKETYGATVVRLLCLATALFTSVFLHKRFSFFPLILIGASFFALNWIMDYRRSDTAFLLFLLCFCMLLVKKTNLNLYRHSRSSLTALLTLPLCIAAVWVAAKIPGEEATYTGQAMSRIFDRPIAAVNDYFYLAFNPKYFTFQTTGFTGVSEQLGGPVALDTRPVMFVDASRRLYLSGATKNTYTGSAWVNTLQDGDLIPEGYDAGRFEYLETAAALIRGTSFVWTGRYSVSDYMDTLIGLYPQEDIPYLNARMLPYMLFNNNVYINSYLPLGTVSVDIGASRTGTLFRPPKAGELSFAGETPQYQNSLHTSVFGDLRTSELMAKNTVYQYRYLNPDRRLTVVKDLLNSSQRGLYSRVPQIDLPADMDPLSAFMEIMNSYVYETGLLDTPHVLEQTPDSFRNMLFALLSGPMADYADNVYTYCTTVPDSVPQRVYDLAESIVKDCATDYERVKALEHYLVDFPYTLTPAPVPEGEDFVDYFLFEGREGYCTYYASAMAVLSRCVGIPSRYCEGYLLPPARGVSGLYEVTNRQAHAWVEVYLEGYGWLISEATAPYNYVSEDRPAPSALTGMFAETFQNSPQYEEHMMNFGFEDRDMRVIEQQTAPVLPNAAPASRSVYDRVLGSFIFLLGCAVSVFIFILVQHTRESLRLRRVSHMEVNTQAQVYFKGILKMTNYYHYPLQTGETPRAYGRRVGKRFAFKSDSIFLYDLITLYYKAKYGGKPLTEKELSLLKDCYFDIIRLLRYTRILPQFMFLRYVRRVTLL